MTDKELLQEALNQLEHYETKPEFNSNINKTIAALRARLAQPEQEPVKDWVTSHNEICVLLRQAHDALALTSYPPKRKWVGLTYADLYFWGGELGLGELGKGVLRAVDAHLREKNNG